ncbi:hypothetical protein RQN30_07580 [Arcanobacterium hippocoleae]
MENALLKRFGRNMTNKKKYTDLPKPLAFVFTVIAVLVIPLPFAAYLGGIDWITQGSQAGLREFIVAYLLGLGLLIVGLGVAIFRGRKEKDDKITR